MHKQSGSRHCEMPVAYSGPYKKVYYEASAEILHG